MSFTRGTIVKSFFWKLFERVSVQLIQFIVMIVLARLLMPSAYGIVALITVFISLCDVIIDSGLNTALIQKKNADNLDFSTIFFFSIGLALAVYGIMFMSASAIADFYSQPELVPVIRVLSISLVFGAINSVQRAYVSKNMLFKRFFYSCLLSVIISGCLGIFLAYRGFGVWALVGQTVSNQFFTLVVMWFLVRWRPVMQFSFDRFKELYSYGWKILAANLITSLFTNFRKLVIGKYYAPESLAYYEKGDQLPMMAIGNIFSSVQTILLPTLADSQDDRHKVKMMMRRSTKLSCFFIYPIMVGMIVAAKPIVLLLLSDRWLPVVPFLQIMCIANFFRPITISNWEAIKALGYSGITLKLELVKKVVDVVILVVSALIGVFAIAWGCVLFNFLCIFINLYPNRKLLNYGVKEQIADAIPTLLISLLMGAAVYWIQFLEFHLIAILTLQLLIGLVVYVSLSYVFKEESFLYITQMIIDNRNKIRETIHIL